MRKVTLRMSVSLDGFAVGTDGDMGWVFPSMGPDLMGWILGSIRAVDTILFGRAAYLEQAALWPGQPGELADLLNADEKIVFSGSLTPAAVTWTNARLAAGTVEAEIARLKGTDGGDIYVTGGIAFARSLSGRGLLDEYVLLVHPVLLGNGRRLFDAAETARELVLVDATSYDAGAVRLTYRPA